MARGLFLLAIDCLGGVMSEPSSVVMGGLLDAMVMLRPALFAAR